MKNAKYSVGQTLWFVPTSRFGDQRSLTISRVGRDYLHCNRGSWDERFFIKDLTSPDGTGKCYISRESYDLAQSVKTEWMSLNQDIRYLYEAPSGVTHETISQIRTLLGLEKK